MSIRKLVKEPISSIYIQDAVPGVNFIPYNHIRYIRSLDELLGKNGMCVIIYLTGGEVGHFVTIFLHNGKIQYFNSYGMEPDDDLRIIAPEVRQQLNETYPYLFRLICDSGYASEYNEYKLQRQNTSTCGRHCIVRLWNKHLDSEEYAKKLLRISKQSGYSPDEVVTILTNNKK